MPDSILHSLLGLCRGNAEADAGFLLDAFVLGDNYYEILKRIVNPPLILLGRKGVGKTAIAKYLNLKSENAKISTLYLKPDDIPFLDGFSTSTDLSTIKRNAYDSLVTAIATKEGSKLRGLLNRKEKKLFDKAIQEGARTHDSIQACCHALLGIGSAYSKVDMSNTTTPDSGQNIWVDR